MAMSAFEQWYCKRCDRVHYFQIYGDGVQIIHGCPFENAKASKEYAEKLLAIQHRDNCDPERKS
jgi:hypothetical protein